MIYHVGLHIDTDIYFPIWEQLRELSIPYAFDIC